MKFKQSSKWALFSLNDTSHAIIFAKKLKKLNWNIIATKETASILLKEKINCLSIDEFVGNKDNYSFPPTLHPKIELALTGKNINSISLVYDIPYGKETGNDVGGYTLLALAVKGNRIPVTNHEDMKRVISELDRGSKNFSSNLLKELHEKTNFEIANHYLNLNKSSSEKNSELIVGKFKKKLLNGENPYQKPCIFFKTNNDDLGLTTFQLHSKTSACFTNMADFDSILKTLTLLNKVYFINYGKIPFISIASKHGNPCGIAVSWKNKDKTITKALYGNPLAVWGGEFICNFKIDEKLAKLLIKSSYRKKLYGSSSWLLDIIISPYFNDKSLKILKKRKSRKIFSNVNLKNSSSRSPKWSYRHVRGGLIKQPHANYILNKKSVNLNFKHLDNKKLSDFIISWAAAFTSFHGGNEVAISKNGTLLACAGGPSTVQATLTAIERIKKIGHDTKNSIFAADAFFPFIDAPELLVKIGCMGGVVPLGSKKDTVIKKFFLKNKIEMIYLPNDIRGFCRH